MPTITTVADDAVHAIIFDVALKAAIAAAVGAVPFLALPVVYSVFSFIMTQAANLLYAQLSRFVIFSIIDKLVNQENSDYQAALAAYKNSITKGNDPNEEQNAQALRDSLSKLINLKPL